MFWRRLQTEKYWFPWFLCTIEKSNLTHPSSYICRFFKCSLHVTLHKVGQQLDRWIECWVASCVGLWQDRWANEYMDNWMDWQHHLTRYFTWRMPDNLSTTLQLPVPSKRILEHDSRHLQKAIQNLKTISSLTWWKWGWQNTCNLEIISLIKHNK